VDAECFDLSRKGNCWDNAPTESFFNSLKNERVHGTRYATRDDAIADLFDYIEVFYNRSRRHSTLGYHSPVQFLQDWITNQHERGQVLAGKLRVALMPHFYLLQLENLFSFSVYIDGTSGA
jgi:hypothetical protein